jgi:Tfp pilus assembly protein PilV
MNIRCATNRQKQPRAVSRGEEGFTLIEAAIAMVIIMVVMLGVFLSMTYAITYNAGNYSRAQSLAVLQAEAEKIRSAKFTPSFTDSVLWGGVQATRGVTLPNGTSYSVDVVVDNDPYTAGVQDETVATSYKEITITANLANPTPGWQTAVPTKVIMRRVKSN